MGDFTEFIEKAIDEQIGEIQLGMIGKIEKFDKSLMRADVQPLMKLKDNENDLEVELPILSDLPVLFERSGGFVIRPIYENGDLVWIGFATHDIENALKEYSRLASEKKFELQNACIMGGITKDNFISDNPILFEKDGLIIGHEKSGISLRITEAGIFVSNGTTEFNLLTHVHITGVGPSGQPTPGS